MLGYSVEENKVIVEFFCYLMLFEVQYFWYQVIGYVLIIEVVYEMVKVDGYYDCFLVVEIGVFQLLLLVGEFFKGYCMGFYVQVCDVMNCEYICYLIGEIELDVVFDVIKIEVDELLVCFVQIQN